MNVRRDRPRPRTLAVVLVLLTALTVWRLRSSDVDAHELLGTTMGTTWSVRIDADLSTPELDSIRARAQMVLDDVESMMSTYDSASEVSRFNRHVSTDPFSASYELLDLIELSRDVSERSDGAFDVTVAPLVEAWGFGPGGGVDGRLGPRPDEALLADLRASVGYEKLVVDRSAGTLAKTHPRTTIDLSAIAKGYGVHRVVERLMESGLENFLVEVGGELEARGTTGAGRAWRVGIERPDQGPPGFWGVVNLTDEAIATSGDYRNYYEESGVRYAHVIDPRTGAPLPMRGASVSVVHASAALADAWATALTVLGPDEGYRVAQREGLAVLFIEPAPGGFQSLLTPALGDRFAVGEAPP